MPGPGLSKLADLRGPSQYPPIGLFDTVATAADLEAVMELAGWTNDRLVPMRLHRLPQH